MAVDTQIITKRMAIDKASTQMVIIISVASFVSVFCLFACHSLWSQNSYQARVIKAKQAAKSQLQNDLTAYSQLSSSYQSFNSATTNLIGGSSTGSGQNDGTNSQIITDALPISYDFPRLASSIDNLLTSHGLTNVTVSGTDDQIAQQANTVSDNPQATPIPFSFTVTNASYASVTALMLALQQSIRPIQVDTLTLTGASGNMTLSVTAHTFYQPGLNFSISKKAVE